MSTYTIITEQDNTGLAPLCWRWTACFGDVDVGADYGFGATEAEAVHDLLSTFVAPWEAA